MLQPIKNSSTSTDAWPADAIPMHWIESLFEKMLFTYGAKFSDQWKSIDPEGLKRHWAEKLGHMSASELRTGVANLGTMEWPPTLPEFVKACKPEPKPAAHVFALESPKSDLSREKAAQMMEALGASGVLAPKTDHGRWYREILERHKRGDKTLSMIQIQFAQEAAASHGYSA